MLLHPHDKHVTSSTQWSCRFIHTMFMLLPSQTQKMCKSCQRWAKSSLRVSCLREDDFDSDNPNRVQPLTELLHDCLCRSHSQGTRAWQYCSVIQHNEDWHRKPCMKSTYQPGTAFQAKDVLLFLSSRSAPPWYIWPNSDMLSLHHLPFRLTAREEILHQSSPFE